jgi:hypothetical protein
VRRKAAVVAAVRAGVITVEEACRSYQLSEEEFLAWQRAFEAHGLPGLRTTRIGNYRNLGSGAGRHATVSSGRASGPHDDTTHADSDKVIEPCDLVVRRPGASRAISVAYPFFSPRWPAAPRSYKDNKSLRAANRRASLRIAYPCVSVKEPAGPVWQAVLEFWRN